VAVWIRYTICILFGNINRNIGLDHIIPLLQEHGITTPNKLAALSLRDMYEVGTYELIIFKNNFNVISAVGVNDAEDRKKLHFLIQRLQNVRQILSISLM
jgi:hypothetical protein